MTRAREQLLVQEVNELTGMFRHDDDWADLRRLVASHGLEPQTVLLAGYYEGEEGQEYACFVTLDGMIIDYQGRSDPIPRPMPVIWQDRSGDPSITDSFAAAEVGRKMAMGIIESRWITEDA
jgi:hypothetical protein